MSIRLKPIWQRLSLSHSNVCVKGRMILSYTTCINLQYVPFTWPAKSHCSHHIVIIILIFGQKPLLSHHIVILILIFGQKPLLSHHIVILILIFGQKPFLSHHIVILILIYNTNFCLPNIQTQNSVVLMCSTGWTSKINNKALYIG